MFVVVGLGIWAAGTQVDGPATVQRPTDVIDLQPQEGQLALPQTQVIAQVRPIYQAQLTVNGHVIPDDQIDKDPNLGVYQFEPGPGKEFSELPKGANHALVQWWPRSISTIEKAKAQNKVAEYGWAFKVG